MNMTIMTHVLTQHDIYTAALSTETRNMHNIQAQARKHQR